MEGTESLTCIPDRGAGEGTPTEGSEFVQGGMWTQVKTVTISRGGSHPRIVHIPSRAAVLGTSFSRLNEESASWGWDWHERRGKAGLIPLDFQRWVLLGVRFGVEAAPAVGNRE